jgi:hypothetical protein
MKTELLFDSENLSDNMVLAVALIATIDIEPVFFQQV